MIFHTKRTASPSTVRMYKPVSKPYLTPSGQVNKFLETDLSAYDLERNYMLPPISAQVPAQKVLYQETPYGESCSREGSRFPHGNPQYINTQPQLPASWTMHDIYSVVPDKSRKMIKRTLKDKHISKGKMCNMVQQTVEWIKLVCMDVILPALFLCLKEEESLVGKVQVLQKRAEEWQQLNSGSCMNIDGHITSNDWTKGGQILDAEAVNSQEQAKKIGTNISACIMWFLNSKNLSVMMDARCSLETGLLDWSNSVVTLEHGLKQELIHTYTKDLINSVYQELLVNGMGKNLPLDHACSGLLSSYASTEMSSRWEFYMFVLHYFSQQTARNHVELFLGLPNTLHQDCLDNLSTLEKGKTKAERTTLSVLTKIVTDTVMDIINEATDNPLQTAEMFRKGKKSGAQYADDNLSCNNESELLRSSPKPETPEPEMFSPSAEIPGETIHSEEELELKDLVGESPEPTDSIEELELEDLLAESPAPTDRSSQGLKEVSSDKASLQNQCNDCISQGQPDWQCQAAKVNQEIAASSSPIEMANEKISQNLVLPYHLIEKVVDGLLTKCEATHNINIPGIYLCDALVNKLVQELAHLAGIRVSGGSNKQLFSNEDEIILQVVNEAYDIVKDKSHLKAAWYDDEMAANYLAAIMSAVIIDYTALDSKTEKKDCTENSLTPVCPNSTSQERKRRPFLSRIRESLRKLFCFKRNRNQVEPCVS